MQRFNQEDFIKKLQSEALFQSRLEHKKLLPDQLGGLGRLTARYSWQIILVISGVSALIKVLIKL